jgi:hypothetical protein
MMTKYLTAAWALLIIFLCSVCASSAGQITLAELTQQLGIQPDVTDLKTVSRGGSLTARIEDASKLRQIGLAGANKGDKVRLTNMGNSTWLIDLPPHKGAAKIRTSRNVNPAVQPRIKIKPLNR